MIQFSFLFLISLLLKLERNFQGKSPSVLFFKKMLKSKKFSESSQDFSAPIYSDLFLNIKSKQSYTENVQNTMQKIKNKIK